MPHVIRDLIFHKGFRSTTVGEERQGIPRMKFPGCDAVTRGFSLYLEKEASFIYSDRGDSCDWW